VQGVDRYQIVYITQKSGNLCKGNSEVVMEVREKSRSQKKVLGFFLSGKIGIFPAVVN